MKINKGSWLAKVTILVFLLTTLSSSLTSSLRAQESSNSEPDTEQEYVQEEVELTRAAIQKDRRGIVNEYMDLTSEESQNFWPLYEQYRSEATELNDQLTKIIIDYSDSYKKQNLTGEQAQQMLSDYLALEQEKLDLREDYVTKFQQILPPIKVTRYFQLENKMDAIVNFDLAGSIPLVE